MENENDEKTDIAALKYYAVVAMCGHAGVGYFVPILFSSVAKDKDTAIENIKQTPRVKNRAPRCILAMQEISLTEARYLQYLNDHDIYLTTDTDKQHYLSRRIILPNYAQMLVDKNKNKDPYSIQKKQIDSFDIQSIDDIKLVDDYSDRQILQKYFAPRRVGDQIVFPKRVDMDLLLDDYFYQKTRYFGIDKHFPAALAYYYMIYGPGNKFGISVEGDKIGFIGANRTKEYVEMNGSTRKVLDYKSDYRLKKALLAKNRVQNLEDAQGSVKSGLERFASRMQKTLEMQGKNKR